MTAVPLLVPAHIATDADTPRRALRRPGPCTLVILGAGGDLTRRKLMPALYHLVEDGLLDDGCRIVGVAREALTDAAFRQAMRATVDAAPAWARFAERLTYVRGDLDDPATYAAIGRRLDKAPAPGGRLFYLALPPPVYATTIAHLSESGLAPRQESAREPRWARVVIEKPFGRDRDSARALNAAVGTVLAEHQVYRIDHYLGKETVQNLLLFRFANSIFEPVWNRAHVDQVQITAAETVGVEHRAGYYERAGVLRDMFQNHLLQLLTLTAMEPPVTMAADAVRDEKVKVLRAIRPITAATVDEYAVRGQYGPGAIDGDGVPGYREEPGVASDSATPTYAALRLQVDNWRWQGVPFFLRSGKRLARHVTEIAIRFRCPPHQLFALPAGESLAPNVLRLRIQPAEGIALSFEIKTPGVGMGMRSVQMDFAYATAFGPAEHSAYETLLLDCMLGDATLFNRRDAVEAAWDVVDPVTAAWDQGPPPPFPNYASGSWGPPAADALLARAGAAWRTPEER